MSVQDDESGEQSSDQQQTEKPEPDPDAEQKFAEMMQAYEGRPTVVLPGSDGTITGTAVNEWLDEDGDPKFADDASGETSKREQIEQDKARNVELREAAAEENKGEA